MPAPAPFTRATRYREAEDAGLDISTADLDTEFDALVAVIGAMLTRLGLIQAADGRLIGVSQAIAASLVATEEFTAAAAQTVFVTTIDWDSQFSADSVAVTVDGVALAPSQVAVADDGGALEVTITPATPLAGTETVVVRAFSPGAGVLTRLASTLTGDGAALVSLEDADGLFAGTTVELALRELRLALNAFLANFTASAEDALSGTAQTVWDTAIPWDDTFSTTTVGVVADDVVLAPGDFSVSDNAGSLRVTTAAPADEVHVTTRAVSDLWTRDGVGIGGGEARSDFRLGGFRVRNLGAGVEDTDAATIAQVRAFAANIGNLLALFIRKDGAVDFESDQSMGGYKLTDVGAPDAPTDAARKAETDLALHKAGTRTAAVNGTITGPLTLGSDATDTADADQTTSPGTVSVPTLHGVPAPGADDHVVNKKYVDDAIVAGATSLDDQTTTETDLTKRLAPDGANGVQWVTGPAVSTGAGTTQTHDMVLDTQSTWIVHIHARAVEGGIGSDPGATVHVGMAVFSGGAITFQSTTEVDAESYTFDQDDAFAINTARFSVPVAGTLRFTCKARGATPAYTVRSLRQRIG